MRERFRTKLAYRIAPWLCTSQHFHHPTLPENAPDPVWLLWRFDYDKSVTDYSQVEYDRMVGFLQRHGIGPLVEGASVFVVEKEDGTRWVDTWQAVDGYPAASDVPNAIKQERVEVPLVGEIPEMEDAFVPYGAMLASSASG